MVIARFNSIPLGGWESWCVSEPKLSTDKPGVQTPTFTSLTMTFILEKESIACTSITIVQMNQPEHMYAHAHLYTHCHHKGLWCTLFNLCFWYTRSCHSYCHFCMALSRAVLMGLELNSLRRSIKSQILLSFALLDSTAHLKLSCKQKGILRG